MILKENDFLYMCKLNDITAIQAKEMLKNSNVVLENDLEDFLSLCRAFGTSAVFYDFTYYSKDQLRISEDIKTREVHNAYIYKGNNEALRTAIAECIDKWNELIKTFDYTQPCILKLIASIDDIITEAVYSDFWLNEQFEDINIRILPDMTYFDIASNITHQLVLKHTLR